MILAKEKSNYYDQHDYSPRPRKRVRKVKKVKKNHKAVYVFVVLVAFLMGIFFTARYAQVAMQGYKINQLKEHLAAIQADNQRLQMEANRLASLDRIEKIAMSDLGMVKPEGVQFVAVENVNSLNNTPVEPENRAIKTAAVTNQDSKVNPVLENLVKFLNEKKGQLEKAEAGQGN